MMGLRACAAYSKMEKRIRKSANDDGGEERRLSARGRGDETVAIPDDIKMTPWLSQYRQWKAEYPDALLLFRMGDFYELFFDDARTAASILDIALTARDAERKIPMAGVIEIGRASCRERV